MNIKEKSELCIKNHETALCQQEQLADLICSDQIEELNVQDVQKMKEIHFTIERDHY